MHISEVAVASLAKEIQRVWQKSSHQSLGDLLRSVNLHRQEGSEHSSVGGFSISQPSAFGLPSF